MDLVSLDIDELETTPTNLSKPSNLVSNNVVKKSLYEELAKKVNAKKIPKHDKYIIAREFSKLTAKNFAERLKQAKLPTKYC